MHDWSFRGAAPTDLFPWQHLPASTVCCTVSVVLR
jgi:hypothetical protein